MREGRLWRRRNWLELLSTVVALFVSIVSLWVAVRSEQANSQMVDANYKMVAASSWPYLQVSSSNNVDNKPAILLKIENAGVGPAKMKTFEVFWKGQAYPSAAALLEACCAKDKAELIPMNTAPPHGVLRAGDSLPFLQFDRTPQYDAIWRAFDRVRFSELSYRICYCSVFDECRVSDIGPLWMQKDIQDRVVKSCPKPAVPYFE